MDWLEGVKNVNIFCYMIIIKATDYVTTVYVEIFEWLNFRKKSAVSNFENNIFKNGARV